MAKGDEGTLDFVDIVSRSAKKAGLKTELLGGGQFVTFSVGKDKKNQRQVDKTFDLILAELRMPARRKKRAVSA